MSFSSEPAPPQQQAPTTHEPQEQQDQQPKTYNDDEHGDEIEFLGVVPARTRTRTTTTTTTTTTTDRCSINIINNNSNSAPKPKPKMFNPYLSSAAKRKSTTSFVGGAEMARRNARKKARSSTRIVSPMERERLNEVLTSNMNPMERFGAALLRTSPLDLVASEGGGGGAPNSNSKGTGTHHKEQAEIWAQICQRVELQASIPSQALPPHYDVSHAKLHFAVRAALVLEEARTAIAQPLAGRWGGSSGGSGNANGNSKYRNGNSDMILTAHYFEKNNSTGHVRVTFRRCSHGNPNGNNSSFFTKDELFHIRPGSVFHCLPRDSARTLSDVVLGLVTSSIPRKKDSESSSSSVPEFNLMWFRDIPSRIEGTEWVVTPLQTLISELRCFEALTNPDMLKLPFLHDILGGNNVKDEDGDEDGVKKKKKESMSQHWTFDDDGQAWDRKNPPSTTTSTITDFLAPAAGSNPTGGPFCLPALNKQQEKAAHWFLKSPQNTITLIQGPPGTGTWFLFPRHIVVLLLVVGLCFFFRLLLDWFGRLVGTF